MFRLFMYQDTNGLLPVYIVARHARPEHKGQYTAERNYEMLMEIYQCVIDTYRSA